jgi:hypothetical protein
MARSGNRHVAILESPTKSAVIISRFRQGDTHRALFIGALIADRNFRASAGYAEPLRAWPVAEPTMVVNSTGGFGCDWCGRDIALRVRTPQRGVPATRHVERSRDISNYRSGTQRRTKSRDSSTPLGMTTKSSSAINPRRRSPRLLWLSLRAILPG